MKKDAPQKSDEEQKPVSEPEREAAPETIEIAEETAPPDMEALLAAERDKYMRLYAEYDNYRRRSQKEREALYTDVRADAVARFLPVYDNLSRALKIPCGDEAFYKGVELIMGQLDEILKALGAEVITAVGEAFDPERHNAVQHTEDPELGTQVVTEEFQAGFTLNGKVIRHAIVAVAN